MHKKNSRFDSAMLLCFLVAVTLVLTNGFVTRIFAQEEEVDAFLAIEPIGAVLDTVLDEYVQEPDVDRIVEGALIGMMNSLDRYSSYISMEAFQQMREETRGEFEGIGVSIRFDDDKNIVVFQPIAGSPAAKAGVHAGDFIVAIDDTPTTGMSLEDAANMIRGPKNTIVRITVVRRHEEKDPETLDFDITRGNVPLESIKEARLLDGGIGYVRISDFKDTTAKDLEKRLSRLLDQGMTSLVLDLRWNPGGLLGASKSVCELFLPKNTLVTYTQGRKKGGNNLTEDLKLYTERDPLLPETFPIVILINDDTASCSEIVTGALQYWTRAIVVGSRTFGKGSVQTIIPLQRPSGSALRLTTALYYTPAEVTIDGQGIKPDVEVPMDEEAQKALLIQMYDSYKDDASMLNQQNHGTVTGAEQTEELAEDAQLARAVEIIQEDTVFSNLIEKYHKDTHETQVAATSEQIMEKYGNGKKAVVIVPEGAEMPEGLDEDEANPEESAPSEKPEPATAP